MGRLDMLKSGKGRVLSEPETPTKTHSQSTYRTSATLCLNGTSGRRRLKGFVPLLLLKLDSQPQQSSIMVNVTFGNIEGHHTMN